MPPSVPTSAGPTKELKEKQVRIRADMKALHELAEKENRPFTEEEQARWDAWKGEVAALDARIARADEMAGMESRAAAPAGDPEIGRTQIRVREPEKDPSHGFRSHRDFLMAVMDAGMGRRTDKRLSELRAKPDPVELRAVGSDEASSLQDPLGGFLLPETFIPRLLRLDPEMDPIGGLTTRIPMSTSIIRIPFRVDKDHTSSVSGGLTVTRRPETVAAASSRMSLKQLTLQAHSLMGLSYAPEELLEDSPISFAALLSAGFSEQFTSHLINERLNGTGIGEYLGVLNSPALISVAKEAGQAASTILWENVVKMRARCWGYSNAIWLANHDTLPSLMLMNQTVGLGGVPVWMPGDSQGPERLLGRPLVMTEYTKTLGTKGDILLVNWAEYLEGVLSPLQSAESVHVRFINHERTFKFWTRNAGAPWWESALTPKNGAATLSPFVALDTRA